MNFFINKEFLRRENGYVDLNNLGDNTVSLKLTLVGRGQLKELVEFVFPGTVEQIEKNNYEVKLTGVKLKQKGNVFTFTKSKKQDDTICYALMRSDVCIDDDMVCRRKDKSAISVVFKYNIIDDEADYGGFYGTVYFLKITPSLNSSVPIYLAYDNYRQLTKHYVFYRHEKERSRIGGTYDTFLYVDAYDKDNYAFLKDI